MTGIRGRKAEHIDICLKERIAPDNCYWDDIRRTTPCRRSTWTTST